MEDQVNVIVEKEESKSSDAINTRNLNSDKMLKEALSYILTNKKESLSTLFCCRSREDQVNVIVKKEESKPSDAINPRYLSDEERFKEVRYIALVFCLISFVFSAWTKILLLLSDSDSKFSVQLNKFMMEYFTLIVLLNQMVVASIVLDHPVNSSIYSILFILLLSSVISVAEVSFVSWNAAIIVLIFWVVIIASIANFNREVIYNIDIKVSNGIQRFIAISFILNLIYTGYCIVHDYVIVYHLCNSS